MNILNVDIKHTAVLMLSEDINIKNIEEFEQKISNLLEGGCRYIVIEFSNVRYIVTEAISILLGARKILHNRGGDIVLSNVSEYVNWVIVSCCGKNMFPAYEDVEKALEAIPQ
jgi:anti-anti-sigma factor